MNSAKMPGDEHQVVVAMGAKLNLLFLTTSLHLWTVQFHYTVKRKKEANFFKRLLVICSGC